MKKLFITAILLMIILTHTIAIAQSVDTAWVRRYDGSSSQNDQVQDIAVDDSGNVYVTGGSGGLGTWLDCVTLKYDACGNELWVGRYNGSMGSDDMAYDLALDDSGNVFVTGVSSETWTGADYVTIKYYPAGDTAWARTYCAPGEPEGLWDYSWAITVVASGNVVVTGQSMGLETNYDYATIKYYSNGDTGWVRRYSGPGNSGDRALAVTADDSGNVYVTGGSGWTNVNYATTKYDSSGNELWVRIYDGPGNSFDQACAMTVDASYNVYVTGQSWSGTYDDYATIKYCANGDTGWVRRYNGPGDSTDHALAIEVDGFGNVFVTGYSAGDGSDLDYATIKYDSSGTQKWVARYNGPGNLTDKACALAVDLCGDVLVTGSSYGDGTYEDYATIRYDSSGNEVWVKRYNGLGDSADIASSIALDDSGNVYVGGKSWGSGTSFDYTTIKYVQTETSVEEQKNQNLVLPLTLLQNYPNPFNPETRIEYYLHKPTWVNLTLYNILGQKVKVLVDEFQTAGTRSVSWNGKDANGRVISSGIYFYKLETADHSESRKMLLLK